MKAPLYNANGEHIGEIELKDELFGIKPNLHLLWEVTRLYLANQRQGTHKAKTRAEVNASGRKIYPQKGLGRARHGDVKAPTFVGGGKAHGPRPRDYYTEIPAKIKRLSLLHSLADKAQNGRILVIEKFEFQIPKTKRMVEILDKMGLGKEKTLVLSTEYNKNLYLSGRNIPYCSVLEVKDVNSLEVLNHNYIVIEKDGLEKLEKRFVI